MKEDSKGVITYPKLVFLDGLRGFAAIYVMIGHARWLLWEGYSEGYLTHPHTYNLFQKGLMYFFSAFIFGHQMVLFFFVLSGFVIHLKYAKHLQSDGKSRFTFGDYIFRRTKRIYPPFLFALFLTFILDSVGRSLNFSIYSGNTAYHLINQNIGHSNWELETFIGNLFFLYKNYFPIYGTNFPAWSLKYEWWFYMLYPLFLLLGKRNIVVPTILIIVLFIASFYPAYWPERLSRDVFSIMITWWLGVLLAEVYSKRLPWKFSWCLIFALSALILLKIFKKTNPLDDLEVALFFSAIISFLFMLKENSVLIRMINRLKIFGDFSYTLYIIHFPILVLFSGWVMSYNNNRLPTHFLFVSLAIFSLIGIAYLLHFLTEKPFLRKYKTQEGILINVHGVPNDSRSKTKLEEL